MKMTLLSMVQNILSSMNSDEVNSISDTVEATQVANEVKNAYLDLYGNRELGNFEGVTNLEHIEGDPANVLRIPDGVVQIKWLKYLESYSHVNPVQQGLFAPSILPPSETETIVTDGDVVGTFQRYRTVQYLEPEDFMRTVFDRTPGGFEPTAEVSFLSTSPFNYVIQANKSPSYYTIFADTQAVVFDSFDQNREAYVTGSSAVAWCLKTKEFILEDDFIPDLDEQFFPHLLAEAKSASFVNVKETANSKEEQRARRQLVRSQKYINRDKDSQGTWYASTDYARRRR